MCSIISRRECLSTIFFVAAGRADWVGCGKGGPCQGHEAMPVIRKGQIQGIAKWKAIGLTTCMPMMHNGLPALVLLLAWSCSVLSLYNTG
jgi:hypothetical protein